MAKYSLQFKAKVRQAVLLISLLSVASFSNAMGQAKDSEKVMAAFFMHFTGYTVWPGEPLSKINVCLFGEISFDGFIKGMIKAKPNNRLGQRLHVIYLESAQQLERCQVAFVSQSKVKDAIAHRNKHQLSVLLVSNTKGFIGEGGMVNFFTENQRVRFEVCLDKLEEADIKISAELLRLAVISRKHSEVSAP